MSLNVALSELWCEHLMLIISDVVDCFTCSRFPFAVKWVLLEDSNYKGFLEVNIER